MHAWALGTFMVSVGVFAVQLYGNSSINEALNDPTLRLLYGIVIGGTGIGIIFSMGKQSGTYMNPSVSVASAQVWTTSDQRRRLPVDLVVISSKHRR